VQSLISSTDIKVPSTAPVSASFHPTPIHHVRGRLSVCTNHDLGSSSDSGEYAVVYLSSSDDAAAFKDRPRMLYIQTPQGKRGQHHFLHTVLPQAMSFIALNLDQARRVCITCETGADLSIGVALAALAKFFDEEGEFHDVSINPAVVNFTDETVLSTLYVYSPKRKRKVRSLMRVFDRQRQHQNPPAVDHSELSTSEPLAHHAQTGQ
jgi:tRNA A64-2'-O-ribosylphosphate transferase